MGICEYIRELSLECPAFSGEIISTGFFDEKLGGASVCESGEKNIIREYTDGGRLIEESAKIVYSHVGGLGNEAEAASREKADSICEWVNAQSAHEPLGENEVIDIECNVGGIAGNAGTQKRELICKVRYFERKGEV